MVETADQHGDLLDKPTENLVYLEDTQVLVRAIPTQPRPLKARSWEELS
jgi:hypothetical protein